MPEKSPEYTAQFDNYMEKVYRGEQAETLRRFETEWKEGKLTGRIEDFADGETSQMIRDLVQKSEQTDNLNAANEAKTELLALLDRVRSLSKTQFSYDDFVRAVKDDTEFLIQCVPLNEKDLKTLKGLFIFPQKKHEGVLDDMAAWANCYRFIYVLLGLTFSHQENQDLTDILSNKESVFEKQKRLNNLVKRMKLKFNPKDREFVENGYGVSNAIFWEFLAIFMITGYKFTLEDIGIEEIDRLIVSPGLRILQEKCGISPGTPIEKWKRKELREYVKRLEYVFEWVFSEIELRLPLTALKKDPEGKEKISKISISNLPLAKDIIAKIVYLKVLEDKKVADFMKEREISPNLLVLIGQSDKDFREFTDEELSMKEIPVLIKLGESLKQDSNFQRILGSIIGAVIYPERAFNDERYQNYNFLNARFPSDINTWNERQSFFHREETYDYFALCAQNVEIGNSSSNLTDIFLIMNYKLGRYFSIYKVSEPDSSFFDELLEGLGFSFEIRKKYELISEDLSLEVYFEEYIFLIRKLENNVPGGCASRIIEGLTQSVRKMKQKKEGGLQSSHFYLQKNEVPRQILFDVLQFEHHFNALIKNSSDKNSSGGWIDLGSILGDSDLLRSLFRFFDKVNTLGFSSMEDFMDSDFYKRYFSCYHIIGKLWNIFNSNFSVKDFMRYFDEKISKSDDIQLSSGQCENFLNECKKMRFADLVGKTPSVFIISSYRRNCLQLTHREGLLEDLSKLKRGIWEGIPFQENKLKFVMTKVFASCYRERTERKMGNSEEHFIQDGYDLEKKYGIAYHSQFFHFFYSKEMFQDIPEEFREEYERVFLDLIIGVDLKTGKPDYRFYCEALNVLCDIYFYWDPAHRKYMFHKILTTLFSRYGSFRDIIIYFEAFKVFLAKRWEDNNLLDEFYKIVSDWFMKEEQASLLLTDDPARRCFIPSYIAHKLTADLPFNFRDIILHHLSKKNKEMQIKNIYGVYEILEAEHLLLKPIPDYPKKIEELKTFIAERRSIQLPPEKM